MLLMNLNNQNNTILVKIKETFAKLRERISKFKQTKAGKVVKWTLRTIGTALLVFFFTAIITATVFIIYITQYINPDIGIDLNNLKLDYTSTVYYTDPTTGQPVEEEHLYLNENCVWVNLEDIPKNLVNAFIAIEDQRFWEHDGVDWKRTMGAILNTVTGKDSRYGGSTIDQQLIKNLTGDNEVTIKRKIFEIIRAGYLDKKYSKEIILEAYLNRINLGSTYTGVQVAANSYFGKDVSELTLAECASIAAITQYPTKFNPQLNPENNRDRYRLILDQMYEQGYISLDELNDAKAEELVILPRRSSTEEVYIQSYFTDQVIEEVKKDLIKTYGYDDNYAENLIYTGGYSIYCTMDKEVQDILEEEYAKETFNNKVNKLGEQIESAMIIMDYNGAVKAVVGGRTKTGNRVLNRATQTLRPPGSSIKPLSVYGPAFEFSDITWSTQIEDSPVKGKWPKNQSGTPSGEMITVQRGVALSLNTIAVRVMKEYVTPSASFEFLKTKLHITSIIEHETVNGRVMSDIDLAPLGLGQLTNGISVKELCAGYTIFGSGGYYAEPYFYEQVVDTNGSVVLERRPNLSRAIGEDTAYIMNKILQAVVTSGTATRAQLSGFAVGGKTGTTNDDCDRWFVGYTPYYLGACWVGYDTPTEIRGFSANPAVIMWKNVMSRVHKNLPGKSFPSAPKSVYKASDGGWYRVGTEPYVAPEEELPPEDEPPGEEEPPEEGEVVDSESSEGEEKTPDESSSESVESSSSVGE